MVVPGKVPPPQDDYLDALKYLYSGTPCINTTSTAFPQQQWQSIAQLQQQWQSIAQPLGSWNPPPASKKFYRCNELVEVNTELSPLDKLRHSVCKWIYG